MKHPICVIALVLAACATSSAPAVGKPASPLAGLKVDVPYTRFVLSNGLTVIVNEDRKAPIVHVYVWYKVGSKNEPQGRTGFAHLFEHIMFNGSQNANGDWFKFAAQIGASSMNGTTNQDRTNYYQTVPKGALDSILWLESDRMGHLLGALDQAKLDEQRKVVQNEKRQGDNRPFGLVHENMLKAAYPKGHPYAHTPIGSMEDLNAATLDDVKSWFNRWYGPSNAILVLSGDVSAAEAKEKVERAFGDIPPGEPVTQPVAWVPKRQGTQREVAYDRVAQPSITRSWPAPGSGSHEVEALDLFAGVLGGGKTSRLYRRLVLEEKIATSVGAANNTQLLAGRFSIQVSGVPGADPQRLEQIVDEEVQRLIAKGPTAEELERVRTLYLTEYVKSLERLYDRADLLALCEAFYGSPDAWKETVERLKTTTATQVVASARRWLSDGDYIVHMLPFGNFTAARGGVDRKQIPAPQETPPARFPEAQRTTLANGLKVVLVERRDVPIVSLQLIVSTGVPADYERYKPGTGAIAMGLLDEGVGGRDATRLAEELARLGAALNSGGGEETSTVWLSTLTPTLEPALKIFADAILRPNFSQVDLDRLKGEFVARLKNSKSDPGQAAGRLLPSLVHGADHPYGRLVEEPHIESLTRADLVAFKERWFKPNNATLVVAGDVSMADMEKKLQAALAAWQPGSVPARIKPTARPTRPAVYLLDKPGAVQSVITAAMPAPARAAQGEEIVAAMNAVLGGGFNSRLNMNLREEKGWAYGAGSRVAGGLGVRLFSAQSSVQSDKTADSIAEIRKELNGIVKDRRITEEELTRVRKELTLGLADQWATNNSLVGYLGDIVVSGFPDDYYVHYPQRILSTGLPQVNAAAEQIVKPGQLVWVIVGDRQKIEADIRKLDLGPITVLDTDGKVLH